MARKLRPGIHTVTIRGKQRKVQVLANGKWKFLKGGSSPRSGARPKRASSQSKRVGRRRVRRSRPMAKRGRARRYYRRVKRAVRRFGMPSLLGLGAGLACMAQLGMFDAAKEAMKGNITGETGAVSKILSKMTPVNMIGAAILPIGVAVARKFTGPVNVMKAGRFQIRLI